jgi:hypothetical protein
MVFRALDDQRGQRILRQIIVGGAVIAGLATYPITPRCGNFALTAAKRWSERAAMSSSVMFLGV